MSDRKGESSRTGLYCGEEFGRIESRKRKEREAEMEELVERHGGQQETVYRDKSGKKVDKIAQYAREKVLSEGQKRLLEEAQQEWGVGSIQKKQRADELQDLVDIQAQPFARTIDDPKLERMRKEAVRDGDPMAEYFTTKQEKQSGGSSSSTTTTTGRRSSSGKPMYKGPNPTPNRFGLRPGYRWDAIDRGNRFENKILIKMNEKSSFNEEEYKWRVSDL